MLRYSVVCPMPSGDTLHLSSHHTQVRAQAKIAELKRTERKEPMKLGERYGWWFSCDKLSIRDNLSRGTK